MFFLANEKYFLTRKNIGRREGRGNLALLSVLKTAEAKYIFFKHIFSLHNQICLEKNIAPLKWSVP